MNFHELSVLRPDLAFIAHWVKERSHVLDLGCGDGVMLDYLQSDKRCTGYGIEIDDAKIPVCIDRQVSVIQQDMEAGLAIFADNAFDTVLCLSALQMMKNVEGVLRDVARVGREAIVSFPNFAYWPHRVALLRGRMPVSKSLPYEWYDTPNLRCATIKDFEELANHVGLEVLERVALDDGKPVSVLPKLARQPCGVPTEEEIMFSSHRRLNSRMPMLVAANLVLWPAHTPAKRSLANHV